MGKITCMCGGGAKSARTPDGGAKYSPMTSRVVLGENLLTKSGCLRAYLVVGLSPLACLVVHLTTPAYPLMAQHLHTCRMVGQSLLACLVAV